MQVCEQRNITVSQDEVAEEIRQTATKLSMPVDQLLTVLKNERGITPVQYADDIIWPMLALRKIAGDQLQITPQELAVEYQKYYGPAVRARMIACGTLEKAQRVHAAAVANPEEFGNLAKQESEDVNSASAKGLVNPIRRHLGYKEIEDAAFAMQPGQISDVISVANQFVILKCEGMIEGRKVPFENAKPMLEDAIRESKLRTVTSRLFDQLQQEANVVNILNDPVKSQEMPDVAALINGKRVTIADLKKMCIARHGQEVLEGTISRRLLEQECKRRNVTVTEAEIEGEIARAAGEMLELLPDGSPNVERWLTLVTEQQGVSLEVYRRDAVWPSVALKKLVVQNVQVTQEDMERGFEANYGPRVRCLAIVLDNHRRAQDVWKMARANPSREYFGDLAEEYSVESGSRALRGEVPPIQRHGGQPLLEQEAFALSPGELSSIIQVGERFVILFCEGHTDPVQVSQAEVAEHIFADIREKKTNLAMANYYDKLQAAATIDNLITGTTRSPKPAGPSQPMTAARPVDTSGMRSQSEPPRARPSTEAKSGPAAPLFVRPALSHVWSTTCPRPRPTAKSIWAAKICRRHSPSAARFLHKTVNPAPQIADARRLSGTTIEIASTSPPFR